MQTRVADEAEQSLANYLLSTSMPVDNSRFQRLSSQISPQKHGMIPAATMTTGSGIFLVRDSMANVPMAISMVGRSIREHLARIQASPAIAPTAAAPTP
jgi:hypothetical protein